MDTRPSVKPMLSWKGRCKSNSWPRDLSTNLAHRFGGWLTVEMHLRRGKSFVPATLMGKVVFISEWQWQNTMSCVSIEAKSESRSQIGFVRKACRDVHPKLVSLFLGQLTVVLPVEKHIFLNTFFLRVDFTLNLLDGSPATTWENTKATRKSQPPTIHPTLDPPLHQLPSVGHIARNEQIHVTGTWFLNLGESLRVSSETWDVKNEWKLRISRKLRTTKWTNYLTWLGKFQPCHQQ